MMPFENDPKNVRNLKPLTRFIFFFALAYQRNFIKTHTLKMDITGPENIMFAGTSLPLNQDFFTDWGSEGVTTQAVFGAV